MKYIGPWTSIRKNQAEAVSATGAASTGAKLLPLKLSGVMPQKDVIY